METGIPDTSGSGDQKKQRQRPGGAGSRSSRKLSAPRQDPCPHFQAGRSHEVSRSDEEAAASRQKPRFFLPVPEDPRRELAGKGKKVIDQDAPQPCSPVPCPRKKICGLQEDAAQIHKKMRCTEGCLRPAVLTHVPPSRPRSGRFPETGSSRSPSPR